MNYNNVLTASHSYLIQYAAHLLAFIYMPIHYRLLCHLPIMRVYRLSQVYCFRLTSLHFLYVYIMVGIHIYIEAITRCVQLLYIGVKSRMHIGYGCVLNDFPFGHDCRCHITRALKLSTHVYYTHVRMH